MLFICMATSVLPLLANFTYSINDGQTLTWAVISETEKTCMILPSKDDKGNIITYIGTVEIPEYIGDYKVTVIADDCFSGSTRLKSAVIPNTVIRIGRHAFYNSGLNDIEIGNSVVTIDDGAFSYCKLESVTIPNSVQEIGDNAFFKGPSKVVLGNSVRKIGEYAFAQCSISTINIPNSVTFIGNHAFQDCHLLTSVHISSLEAWCNIEFEDISANPLYDNLILLFEGGALYLNDERINDLVIPESISEIKDYAFPGKFTSITLPNTVTEIGSAAFECYSGLESVHISSLEAWCNINFTDRTANPMNAAQSLILNGEVIKDLVIPESISEIKNYAFTDCGEFTSVTIPESVTTIGAGAFRACTSLPMVTIPNSVTTIGAGAFDSCSGMTNVILPNSITSIENYLFYNCYGLKSVTIPASVTTIGDYAFEACGLTSLTIPGAVTDIGNRAFGACNISEIVCEGEDAPTINSYSFSIDTYANCLVSVPLQSEESYLSKWSDFKHIIPGTLLSKNIHIPTAGTLESLIPSDEINRINEIKLTGKINGSDILCLNKMVNLSKVDLSEATIVGGGEPYYEDYYTSDNTIDRYWAHNLSLLSTVILPANLETIGNYAFEGNRLLLNIIIPGSVTSIGEGAFKDCENLTGLLVIPDSVTSIGSQAFLRCSSLTGLVIGESVEFIGSLAFGDCKNLTGTLIIPNSVTEIGKSAFINCDELTELYLGESVRSIGVHAFTSDSPNGSKLTTLHYNAINCALPDTHNSYTLVFSRTLKTVIIGDKVEAIPPYAFSRTELPEITIPNSVTSIGVSAFEYCRNLTTATIGESVTHIAVGAFTNDYLNSTLTTLYFNAINCETTKFPRTIKNLYIGDKVSQIPDNAFQDCKVLTEVHIPNSVTSIGENAFENCDSLSVLTISNSVTSIGKEAFRYCFALTELIIPESVTFIGEEAFRGCHNLSTLHFNATNCEPPQSSSWHSSPFPEELETIIIGHGVTKIPDSMFNYCSGVRNIIISETVKSIGKDAFFIYESNIRKV